MPSSVPPIRHSQRAIRQGISLIEVLISMFVLLFGLMGVAAIFPVASHYILEGDKRDRSSGLAQIAFEELKAQKILRPELWMYSSNLANNTQPAARLINARGQFEMSPSGPPLNAGWAFVIDPLGTAAVGGFANKDLFPFVTAQTPPEWSSVVNLLNPAIAGNARWPVRRLTLNSNPNLTGPPLYLAGQAAETTFRLRDDLATTQPDAGDRPGIQRWTVGPGGEMLARQYIGDYSWMATVVPVTAQGLLGLQPAANIHDAWYEVSAVVFYKRDIVPSVTVNSTAGSERLINAIFTNRSELALYYPPSPTLPDTIETALDGIKPGNWVAVMGVHPMSGTFLMKWYKIQAVDDETAPVTLGDGTVIDNGRYMMVQGPDWPEVRDSAGRQLGYYDLRVAVLPGIVDVYTRVMQLGGSAGEFQGTVSTATQP